MSSKRKHQDPTPKASKKLRTEPREQFPIQFLCASVAICEFNFLCASVALGSLGPIKYGDKEGKIGSVNISIDDVGKALNEVGLVPLYPVCLKSGNLKENLFNSSKSFTEIRQGK